MKKKTLIALFSAAAFFAACGDDSSSSSNPDQFVDEKGRTVYTDMEDAFSAPCSEKNKCEIIILNDFEDGVSFNDTLQCNGKKFMSMIPGPAVGCDADGNKLEENNESGSGKACLNTFLDGEIRCFTHESVEFLCGGTSSGLKSSELIDECPEGYTLECPDETGNGVTYFYREGMTDCHKF